MHEKTYQPSSANANGHTYMYKYVKKYTYIHTCMKRNTNRAVRMPEGGGAIERRWEKSEKYSTNGCTALLSLSSVVSADPSTYVRVCVYVCMYVCMCVCIYTYIPTRLLYLRILILLYACVCAY